MSGIDTPRLEHGHGAALYDLHHDHVRKAKRWNYFQILVGSLLIVLSAFFVLFLQWHADVAITLGKQPEVPTEADTNGEIFITPQRDLKALLHPEDHVSREPRINYLSWNITSSELAPDGVVKRVLLINGQFPGPAIEARSGDTLEVEVYNSLDVGVSLHWHGLYMRGANHMDGPVGLTQCAIPPGGNFTYRIPIDGQAGTFWYHAHSEVLRGDGLYGGLVVHNPDTPEHIHYKYDKELLFLVGDWYHRPAKDILEAFMSPLATGNEPNPPSLLINGLGYFECSKALPAYPVNCSDIQKPWLQLDKKERYRIRLANVGSLTPFSLSIPDSEMKVIQLDGGYPVVSDIANTVGVLYPAERADLVVEWTELTQDTDSQIIIELDHEYFLEQNFALTPTQSFLLSAENSVEQTNATDMGNKTTLTRFDLQSAKGPTLAHPLPEADEAIMLYSSVQILSHQNYRPMGFINHTSWRPQDLPLIAVDRDDWNQGQIVSWTGPEPAWVDLVINNIDGTGHPFHLHGFDFYVIASYEGTGGWDYYNPYDESRPPRGGPFNLVNPVRKDTVLVPRFGYAVIRFFADNEGIWALHCHLLWHQGSGMSMAVQVLGDEHKGLSDTSMGLSAKDSCTVR
ncbi:Multicopper oxidase [Pleurostoma richardsiae]|uniref:Multicopper oxidase n=1 Tax=Pleurostoma richardsiae TaxID=41990 RepID=A0AA38RTW6_9PEZI|nr:Multicopper oxidase [Pleurostoma richardsiae]